MTDDVHDAIASACTTATRRPVAFDVLKAQLLEITRGLPDDMTVQDLREELED